MYILLLVPLMFDSTIYSYIVVPLVSFIGSQVHLHVLLFCLILYVCIPVVCQFCVLCCWSLV